MPFSAYDDLSDRDANAIAAYLRTMKPIRHTVAKSQYKMALPESHGPTVTHVKEPNRADRLAYGAYLAGPVAHCIGCHTPLREGGECSTAGAPCRGPAASLRTTGNVIMSRIISLIRMTVSAMGDAEIKRATTAGIRPTERGFPGNAVPWRKKMVRRSRRDGRLFAHRRRRKYRVRIGTRRRPAASDELRGSLFARSRPYGATTKCCRIRAQTRGRIFPLWPPCGGLPHSRNPASTLPLARGV
jgi:mono/diheme cytochrome c family protein